MDEQIKNLESKIDALQAEVIKMRKYFMATFWITIVLFVLPLLALLFVIPTFLSTFSAMGELTESLEI